MKYNIQDIRILIERLSDIFHKVRLVDPVQRRVLSLSEAGEIAFEHYFCHKVWGRKERCKNCTSVHALQSNQQLTKFEFVNDEVYFIISKPILLEFQNGETANYIMELLCKMSDDLFFEAYGKNAFSKKIAAVEKKIYEDPLTKAHNRRYYEERMFLYYNYGEIVKEITFIMVDLHGFKGINDTYGHVIGDAVLVKTANVLKSCVRERDAVIRLGGDEFLLILTNCEKKAAERIVEIARIKITEEVDVKQGKDGKITADFGIAHSSCFANTVECMDCLLEEADRNMYIEKNGVCLWHEEAEQK